MEIRSKSYFLLSVYFAGCSINDLSHYLFSQSLMKSLGVSQNSLSSVNGVESVPV